MRQMFHQEPGLAENYDLILNSTRLSQENMIALVMQSLLELGVLGPNKVVHGTA